MENTTNKKKFIIADLHFSHKKIFSENYEPIRKELLGMKTDTIEEMNELIIQKWNETVNEEDVVYVLGDVSFGRFDARVLNGYKILILGNHDRSENQMYADGWDEVGYFDYVKIADKMCLLTHKPTTELSNKDIKFPVDDLLPFDYNIHGHLHSKDSPTNDHICVSMEQTFGKPMSLDVLEQRILIREAFKEATGGVGNIMEIGDCNLTEEEMRAEMAEMQEENKVVDDAIDHCHKKYAKTLMMLGND